METEGRPEVKATFVSCRPRWRRADEAVAEADVVVTNPTHYAVALKYHSQRGAPRVIAKGKDLIAKAIRDRAEAAGCHALNCPVGTGPLHPHPVR